mgnify:CR=1 FL=1
MAKKKKTHAPEKKAAGEAAPPSLVWKQQAEGLWVPIVTVANVVMPLEPRPYMGFSKGEREAILTWIKQALSEILFDVPFLLVNEKTSKCAKNPDWEMLPYYVEVPVEKLPEGTVDNRPVTYREVKPVCKPTAEQAQAAAELPVL